MTKSRNAKSLASRAVADQPATLSTLLAALGRAPLSNTRRRDLRSAVSRVAFLLQESPAAIPLDLGVISVKLGAVNPVAAGMSAKRLANIRSDFLAAMKAAGLMPTAKRALGAGWSALFKRLAGRRAHIGLSRLAGFASARHIVPEDVNDAVIAAFIAAVRSGSLHRQPDALFRQVTLIWNDAARDPELGLQVVSVPSFRGPPKRIDWESLNRSFKNDVDRYLDWCRGSDQFAADARLRPLAPQTLKLRRDQIHAAVTSLVQSGAKMASIKSLADLVSPTNVTTILRRRLAEVGGQANVFNHYLAKALIQIAVEWVKVRPDVLAELKRLFGKLPVTPAGLTDKNKQFLRQFDDPAVLQRLYRLPEKLWGEVRRDKKPNFRTLAKAQTALAVAILSYNPLRLQNLASLAFDTHLFVREQGTSTLELSAAEVKNKLELAFDIPPAVAKMLIEYRERIAPNIIGHRPTRVFVNADGSPKSPDTVAWLIATCLKKRAGIVITPHQFRHLSAKIILDAEPGAFETVKQLLVHKNLKTTVGSYAGISTRRAARHHQTLVERALAVMPPKPPRKNKRS